MEGVRNQIIATAIKFLICNAMTNFMTCRVYLAKSIFVVRSDLTSECYFLTTEGREDDSICIPRLQGHERDVRNEFYSTFLNQFELGLSSIAELSPSLGEQLANLVADKVNVSLNEAISQLPESELKQLIVLKFPFMNQNNLVETHFKSIRNLLIDDENEYR